MRIIQIVAACGAGVLLLSAPDALAFGDIESSQRHRQLRARSISAEGESFAPPSNDTTFVVDTGQGLDTGCTFRSGSPLIIELPITRVVGDLQTGLITDAVLEISAWDIDVTGGPVPEIDRVTFNGHALVPNLKGQPDTWITNRFVIPISWVEFPEDPGPGGTPTPAINTIRIDIDTLSDFDAWCMAVDWVALHFTAVRPIVYVHGIFPAQEPWLGGFKAASDDQGIPSSDSLDMGALDSYQNNAEKIGDEVSASKTRWGVQRVNLVCHSKGGVDARAYVAAHGDVEKLIQLGTPNLGSPLANLITLALGSGNTAVNVVAGPAGLQLTTGPMTAFNARYRPRPGVDYISLAGDYTPPAGAQGAWDRFLLSISGKPGDTIVSKESAHGMPWAGHPTLVTTAANIQSRHDQLPSSGDAYAQVAGAIEDLSPNSVMTGEDGSDNFLFFTVVAAAEHDTTNVGEFFVDQDVALRVGALFPDGDLDFWLEAPSGLKITRTTTEPGTSFGEGALFGGKGGAYEIDTPETGAWKVWASAFDVVGGASTMPALLLATAEVAGPSIEGFPRTASVLRDGSLVLEARLRDGETALLNATVECWITAPDSTQSMITLSDNGVLPDSTAGDGVYAGTFLDTGLPGYYQLRFVSERTGVQGAPDFSREALAMAAVLASSSTIGGSVNITKVDLNANGLADLLRAAVSITTSAAGDFTLVGTLEDALGNELSASTSLSLPSGTTTVNLDFDGTAISRNGIDGPYSIGGLALFEEGPEGARPPVSSVSVTQTNAYGAIEFEHEVPVQLIGSGFSEGVLLGGTFGWLRVRLPVHVDFNGTYRLSAILTDSTGAFISSTGGEPSLTAGADTLVLNFPGCDIGDRGVDGKYEVRELWVAREGGRLFEPLVHETVYFYADQFQCGPDTHPNVFVAGSFAYDDSLLGSDRSIVYPLIVAYDTKDRCATCDSTALQVVGYGTIYPGSGGGWQIGQIPNIDRDDDNGPLDLMIRVYYVRVRLASVLQDEDFLVSLADSAGALWHFDSPVYENVDEELIVVLKATDPAHAAALHILNTLDSGPGSPSQTAWDWVNTRFGALSDSILSLTVRWSPGYSVSPGSKGTKYDQDARTLYVDGRYDTLAYSPDAWDDPIVLREFSHHLAVNVGMRSVHSGSHPTCNTQADSAAWDEGFAQFYASYLQASRGQSRIQNDYGMDIAGTRVQHSFDIEDGCSTPPCPGGCENADGPTNARAVAGALWDLYDGANDNPNGDAFGDSLSDGINNIHTVIAYAQSPIRDVHAFRDAYINQTAKRDLDFRRNWLVRQVFFEHGIDYNLTGAEDAPPPVPGTLVLGRPSPNPFNPSTRISFGLPGSVNVRARLTIFDVNGRMVRRLLDRPMPPGMHTAVWDGRDGHDRMVASGVYYCLLDVPSGRKSTKLVLAK